MKKPSDKKPDSPALDPAKSPADKPKAAAAKPKATSSKPKAVAAKPKATPSKPKAVAAKPKSSASPSADTGKKKAAKQRRAPKAVAIKVPKVGFVSLGCPKALVDSERIISKLRAEGYEVAPNYDSADVVVVNTCGFLNSAKEESLAAIGEAMSENGRVIVTGCLGVEPERILASHPGVLSISGPHQYERVVEAVHDAAPPLHDPFTDLVPPEGIRLTPRHYAYLKISEGCNNTCSFCIIPDIRGKLQSRPVNQVLAEAERLVNAGVKELLVISQDTSAYGVDLKYQSSPWQGRQVNARFLDLCKELGNLNAWVRLHYVYPYPHVDDVIPLMAEGLVLPYLDIPFQHASPRILKAMRRPAAQEKTLERIERWRRICPDLAIRSTFIVGFPGETEEDFLQLVEWLRAARINHVGCFKYEDVDGAKANDLADPVPEDVKEERWNTLMAMQSQLSDMIVHQRVGRVIEVLIDEVDEEGAIGRSIWDAPDVDGAVFLNGDTELAPGDMVRARVVHAEYYDMWAERI